MNDQQRMRVIFGFLPVILVIFVVGLGLLIHYTHTKSPAYTTKLVDHDTGETLLSQPNKAPESGVPGYIVIFGSQVFLDSGATQAQFQLIQSALTKYSQTTLKNQYQTLTVTPSAFSANNGQLSGQLRLGEGNNIVNFAVSLSQLKYVTVKITDPSGQNGGDYDSGRLSTPVQTYSGND